MIGNLGKSTAALRGAWAFHPGDDPAWAAPRFDDAGWARIETGRDWESQGFHNLTGFAWYRRRIELTGAATPADLCLLFSGVEDAGEVYWNGRLVGRSGRVPPNPDWRTPVALGPGNLYWPLLIPLGSRSGAQPVSGVLAIRVWKAPYVFYSFRNEGGLLATPRIGSREAITALIAVTHETWLRSSLYQILLAFVSGIVAVLAFLAWLRDRRQWMLLWLALYTARPPLLFPMLITPWLLPFRWSYGLIAPIVGLQDVSLWFLLLYLLGLRDHARLIRWTRWTAVVCLVFNCLDGSTQIFHWTTWPDHVFLTFDVGFTIPALLLQAYSLVIIFCALRKRLDAARWFLAVTAMLADLDFALSNWFSLGARWTGLDWYRIFTYPLFSVGGNNFDPLTILNTLLLVAIVYAVWRYQAEQSRKQSVLDEEFRNAQELQQMLVPEALPAVPGYRISSAYRPAQVVGGDFFQILPVEGATLAVVGDVSGKGLKAAMTVALIVGALRTLAETTGDPAKLLEGLNRRLHGRLQGGFATCLAVRLETHGDCLVACAGHLPPLRNGEEVVLPGALPLGMVTAPEYTTTGIEMRAGDRLTLYTDGLPEARSAEGELYGFERVQALVAAEPDAERVAAAAAAFGQEDDVTVITVVCADAEDLSAHRGSESMPVRSTR